MQPTSNIAITLFVFTGLVIHHACQTSPPRSGGSPLIATVCAPVKETREGTFASH